MTAEAIEGCVTGMFGRSVVLPLRVKKSGQHCVTCHGRVPDHGGDVQRMSAYYTCVWCGAQGYFFSNPPFETKTTTTTNALDSEKE
jgi:hypothetical protein